MSLIQKYIDKNNLHHAYLIEGDRSQVEAEILELIEDIGVKTLGNADFCHMTFDSLKIDDARHLKSLSIEKSIAGGKRVFLISVNNFLLEAQNSLLKIFEEPIENTHFFLIMPDVNILLKTFLSRFYLISVKQDDDISDRANKFISMSLLSRLNFIKELLTEIEKGSDVGELMDSNRAKSLKFLNTLELTLSKMSKVPFDIKVFEHFFKVRKFLNQPGSSIKSLMESVAIIVPNF